MNAWDDYDVTKSRHACAETGCSRGASTGHVIHRVSADGEPLVGYCAGHLHERPCVSPSHVCDRKAAS